jgi:hypothetical protein
MSDLGGSTRSVVDGLGVVRPGCGRWPITRRWVHADAHRRVGSALDSRRPAVRRSGWARCRDRNRCPGPGVPGDESRRDRARGGAAVHLRHVRLADARHGHDASMRRNVIGVDPIARSGTAPLTTYQALIAIRWRISGQRARRSSTPVASRCTAKQPPRGAMCVSRRIALLVVRRVA